MPNTTPQAKTQPCPEPAPHYKINLAGSLTAGTLCAALFHPWDRALFLAIDNKRIFCTPANFTTPLHGIWQSISYKPFLNSIYYFAQGELQESLYPYLRHTQQWSEWSARCTVGFFAGGIEGVVKNPLSAIKANTWKNGKQGSFLQSVRSMWLRGGWKPFMNGAPAGMSRDVIFGMTYEPVRKNMRHLFSNYSENHSTAVSFVSDSSAAGFATIVCSPFNYARIMQYRTAPGEKPPTILESVSAIAKETLSQPKLLGKFSFFQRSLCIGWGTARVGVGMATGQMVADQVKKALRNIDSDTTPKSNKPF
jgi:hypothetical protein